MWRHLPAVLCLFLLAGCGGGKSRVLGKPPKGEERNIGLVQGGEAPASVVVRGRLVEKCPVAGCWFRLQDETGIIKVDTKAAGFVVTHIPMGSTLTVGGKVVWEGSEAVVQATGLSY